MSIPAIDPYSPAFQLDPYPSYARLRASAPVYAVPGRDLYLVVTAHLVREVLRDATTYSNAATSRRRAQPPAEILAEVEAIRAGGHEYQPALGLSDPRRHTR